MVASNSTRARNHPAWKTETLSTHLPLGLSIST